MKKLFLDLVEQAYNQQKRLVVPLVGFPGLNLTGSTIKLAQQNYGEHYNVVKALAEKLRPDAIFPLMDLSVEANALGRYTIFPKAESATVVKDQFTIKDLEYGETIKINYDTRLLGYVETTKLMSIGLPPSILRGAYVTGPYTLSALLMGADETAMATITRPDELHDVCRFAVAKIHEYIRLLIAAGAQLICILEPSAMMLGPEEFEQFSGDYVNQITDSLRYTDVAVIYHICGNTMHLIDKMCKSGVNAISLDSPNAGVDLPAVAERIPKETVLIGNINPVGSILYGEPEEVEAEVSSLLSDMEPFPNFVLSTGCDLPQETPLKNIEAFMRAGRAYKMNLVNNKN